MDKEYIERETVVTFLENMAASRYLIQCFEDKEKFPAADVAPVVHGEWIECSNELNKYCSVCKKINGSIYSKPPFCENCGAKMDGGNK